MDCIERFLSNNSDHIRIVNFNSSVEMEKFKDYFRQNMTNKFIYPDDKIFCKYDEIVDIDEFFFQIEKQKENIFAIGFTSQLKFLGEDVLRDFFYRFIRVNTEKIVLVAYQCKELLEDLIKKDPRNQRLIIFCNEGTPDRPKKIEFVTNLNLCKNEDICDGINLAYKKIESPVYGTIYIKTDKKKEDFFDSIYPIQNQQTAFSKLCEDFPEIKNQCSEDFCTSEQWARIWKGALKEGSIDNYITSTLKSRPRFEELFDPRCDIEKKSLCFMDLKLHRETQSEYLKHVIENCKNISDFSKAVFNNILDYDCNNSSFSKIYDERKDYLYSMKKNSEDIVNEFSEDFCLSVKKKGKDYIKYLTDCTIDEKQAIIENICVFVNEYSEKEIFDILQKVYPDLYFYLQNYDFGVGREEFTDYISKYKMCKLTNKVTDEFLALEEEQAEKRTYNLLFKPRASVLLDIANKENSSLFFVDSLGVEYIFFIAKKLRQEKLQAKISIARCDELPSITSLNKKFLDEKWGEVENIKNLDILKHNKDFKYSVKEPPFYIVEELKIIDDILLKIRRTLKKNAFEKVILVADHGSSRLCVISGNENCLEMQEKGEHSGRCCPKDKINGCPESATEENGYWVLANYDRFKGGRKSGLEVHGGASIEEVLVPVIEISLLDEKNTIKIPNNLTFSPLNDFEELKFFSEKKLQNVSVNIVGSNYNKTLKAESKDKNNFNVLIPDLAKAGEYKISIFASGKKFFESSLKVEKKTGSSVKTGW